MSGRFCHQVWGITQSIKVYQSIVSVDVQPIFGILKVVQPFNPRAADLSGKRLAPGLQSGLQGPSFEGKGP